MLLRGGCLLKNVSSYRWKHGICRWRKYRVTSLFLPFSHTVSLATLFRFYSALCAKYVNDKAAKWAKSKRPRKSRPSDINRAPIVYAIHSYEKPAEYDISSEPAAPMAKPAATEN